MLTPLLTRHQQARAKAAGRDLDADDAGMAPSSRQQRWCFVAVTDEGTSDGAGVEEEAPSGWLPENDVVRAWPAAELVPPALSGTAADELVRYCGAAFCVRVCVSVACTPPANVTPTKHALRTLCTEETM